MIEASVWTILKELTVGIPRQGRVLKYFLISWNNEVWAGVQGGGLIRSLSKGFALLPEVLIEILDVIEGS